MILKIVILFTSLLLVSNLQAQLSIDWYKNSDQLSVNNPKKSVYNPVDSCIYTAGLYSGQFEMDGLSVTSSYPKAFFLMKTKSNGETVWIKTIAENDYSVELSSNVAMSSGEDGSLLFGITFNRKLFFGSDSIVLPDDVFTTGGAIFKLDTSGNSLWSKQIFAYSIEGVAVNGNNDVLLTGRTVSDDAYLSAYSETGDSIWTRYGGSYSGYDEGITLCIDTNNNIYLGGRVEPNAAVYFDSEHPTFVSPYFKGCFLAKYDVAGNIKWIRCFYTSVFPKFIFYRSICVQGNKVIIAGGFDGGIVKFSPSTTALSSGSDLSTSFLICYDTTGTLLWKKTPHESLSGGTGLDLGESFNEMIVYKGTFSGSFVTDNDTLLSVNNDLFLEAFDTLGNSVWHKQINGANSDGATSFIKAGDDLVLNISTKSNTILVDNTTMTLAPVSDQMVLVRFNYQSLTLDQKETSDFGVFPNPNNGTWVFQSKVDVLGKTLQLFSVSGELVGKHLLQEHYSNSIESTLPSGIYFLSVLGETQVPIRIVI
jgi:hypothetical protein